MIPTLRLGLCVIFISGLVSTPLDGQELRLDESSSGTIERLLDRINRDRERHGAAPVRLDARLSELASLRCARLIDDQTRGHYTTDGLPPYLRYSMAHVYDYISENVASWTTRRPIPDSAVEDLVLKSHNEMVTEIPPVNGHRKTILDPWATHVGLGYAIDGGELRFIEIFARRYVSWRLEPPSIVVADGTLDLAGQIDASMSLREVSIHWEPPPRPLLPKQADAIHSYGFPSRVRVIRNETSTKSSSFQLSVPLDRGPGIYTIVTHLSPRGTDHPIEASTISVVAMPPDGASISRSSRTEAGSHD